MPADTVLRTAAAFRSTARELTDPMRDFLARQAFVTLASHNPDGSIHAVPAWYRFDGDRLYVATWSGSRKARNVAARPEVTVTVDDRDAAAWVSAVGHAEVIRGPRATELNQELRRRYLTDDGVEAIGALLDEAEDATIAVTPARWRAWDYESTLLAAVEADGIPVDDADGWYLP